MKIRNDDMANFRDLLVYHKSYEAALKIYRIVAQYLPPDEMYGLASQIKRAATSIPMNIAEGYTKNIGDKELLRFISMAIGSCAEVKVLLDFLRDLGYISDNLHDEMMSMYDEIGKMLNGFRKSVTANI